MNLDRRSRIVFLCAALAGCGFRALAAVIPETSCMPSRVRGILRDAALQRSWLVTEQCGAPQRPWIAAPAASDPVQTPRAWHRSGSDGGNASRLDSRMAVLSGSRVHLYRWETRSRIDLAGIALESGAPGALIRVRVPGQSRVLSGMVRAEGEVELWSAGAMQ